MTQLHGISVAILVADGFEQSELLEPKKALENAGAKTFVISLSRGLVKGWKDKNWGEEVAVDFALYEANSKDYDALLLPGGVMNPDTLRLSDDAIYFIKHFVDSKKPIAAICHGPWTLINAGGVANKRVTSWRSIREDLSNAGATWVDQSVVRDGNLVTSRKPDDIPEFNKEIITLFSGN